MIEADYDAVLDLNVKSAFFVAKHCVQQILAEGTPGRLVHMGSQMGHIGWPNRSLCCASKWALEGMSKAFALDLAGQRPHCDHGGAVEDRAEADGWRVFSWNAGITAIARSGRPPSAQPNC